MEIFPQQMCRQLWKFEIDCWESGREWELGTQRRWYQDEKYHVNWLTTQCSNIYFGTFMSYWFINAWFLKINIHIFDVD